MRDFHLVVPADCCVSIDPQDNAHALRQMRRALKADATPSASLDLAGLVRRDAVRRRPGRRSWSPRWRSR